MPPLCPIYARAFQEYLEALADEDERPSRRQRRLLLSYAEFLYKIRGGGKCALCRVSVRHILPVTIERLNGTCVEFPCLCTRCIEAEKAISRRVVLKIGKAVVEHAAPDAAKNGHTTPHPDLAKMKALRARAS